VTYLSATRRTKCNRRPLRSSGHRLSQGTDCLPQGTLRPRYIKEGTAWFVFDAGGDLFQYQFRPKRSAEVCSAL
jgi:hypothetical protein